MKPRFLIISLLYPLPENTGGRMRTMNFVRFFKEHGDVDLLYLAPDSKHGDAPGPFREERCIPPNDQDATTNRDNGGKGTSRFGEKWKRLAERRPSVLTEWSPRAAKELASLLTSENYDMILCRYIHNSFPFFRFPVEIRKRVVIDLDDFCSETSLGFSAANPGGPMTMLKRFVESHLIADYQRRCLGFGAVLVCSEKDRAEISMRRKYRNLFVIPNSFPTNVVPGKPKGTGYGNREVFLFVGTLNYGPNVDGISWFVEKIFPEIQKKNGSSRLLIVGRDPDERLVSRCGSRPGIELHANVPDVQRFYERCGMVVVPILSGGGTRIKILEAAMAQRPVLSTPFGAYGLDVTDGEDIMLFTDATSFMEKYDRLMEKDVYGSLAEALRNVVESKYSHEAFNKKMKLVLSGTAEEKG